MSHTPTSLPDSITWRRPFGNWSSIHYAAEDAWRLAETTRRERADGVDPQWLLSGALALALDILEEARKVLGLPLDATVEQVTEAQESMEGIEGGDRRRRFVLELLTYAIEHESDR